MYSNNLSRREISLLSRQFLRHCSSNVKTSHSQVFKQQRLDKLANVEKYPHKFSESMNICQFRHKFDYLQPDSTCQDSEVVKLCGRVVSYRDYGKKLKFIDIERDGASLQLKIAKNNFSSEEDFLRVTDQLARGDNIGVSGRPSRTKSGELSLSVDNVTMLAPCLRKLPSENFESSHKRYRKRYLDFMINPKSRELIVIRAKVIKYLRKFLESRDFLEVETPILGDSVGGANARPFLTWHNDLEKNMSMRIAPELYLKQLIVGGFDKVFEIGKLFRNEGVDHTHNPEFTSCEFYQAYADYNDLILTTEELLSGMVETLELNPKHGDVKLEFKTPFDKIEFIPSLETATNRSFPSPGDLGSEDSVQFLKALCKQHDVDMAGGVVTVTRLLDKLMGKLVEPELTQPTFLLHHPLVMSPLSKEHRSIPGLAERFELFIAGKEVVNAYTELNDPEIQRAALLSQACSSDPEAMLPDEEFCTALEYGLPPTAGWGAGLDRLVMVLTGTQSIRDVITFPMVTR